MKDLVAATKARLSDREAELLALLAEGEKHCQEIAKDGNQRIDAIRAELAKHAEELAGVRHSTATLEQLEQESRPKALTEHVTNVQRQQFRPEPFEATP